VSISECFWPRTFRELGMPISLILLTALSPSTNFSFRS
jgi:hypothetical protein